MTDSSLEPVEGDKIIPDIAAAKRKAHTGKLLVGILFVALLFAVLAILAVMLVHHWRAPGQAQTKTDPGVVAESHTLSMPPASSVTSGASAAQTPEAPASGTRVPSLSAADEEGHAIDVRPNGSHGAHATHSAGVDSTGRNRVDPNDAPIFPGDTAPDVHGRNVVANMAGQGGAAPPNSGNLTGNLTSNRTGDPIADARASLAAYRTQLAGMADSLHKHAAMATGQDLAGSGGLDTQAAAPAGHFLPIQFAPGQSAGEGPGQGSEQGAGSGGSPALFGSLDKSATPRVRAEMLGDRSMIIPKGTLFVCGLTTRVISATSGMVGCQTERNVYSDNGQVLLLERGSHLDGEYRIVQVRPGVTRIPVLWTRVRTPLGVTVDLDSPATGSLGESGLSADVDNRWAERLGAALMLSLIQDAVQYETAKQTAQSGSSTQVILPNTSTEGQKMAEEVLSATINIPPLLTQNQGAIAGVYVARDIDFSSVYALRPQ